MNVYLSKSNASSFEVYSLCKQKLLSLGHTVLEFTGGEYSNKELLRADFLFVVPPERIVDGPYHHEGGFNFHSDSKMYTYEIGKGQTQQILAFANKYSKVKKMCPDEYKITCSRIFLLTEITHRDNTISLYGDQIETLNLIENDWKESWAQLDTDLSMVNIEGSLNTVDVKTTVIPNLPYNIHIHKCNPGSNVRDDGSEVITPMLGTIVLYPHITL